MFARVGELLCDSQHSKNSNYSVSAQSQVVLKMGECSDIYSSKMGKYGGGQEYIQRLCLTDKPCAVMS